MPRAWLQPNFSYSLSLLTTWVLSTCSLISLVLLASLLPCLHLGLFLVFFPHLFLPYPQPNFPSHCPVSSLPTAWITLCLQPSLSQALWGT